MIFEGTEPEIRDDNPLSTAYNTLSANDKARFKYLVMVACNVGKDAFYRWLKNPELITSHNDKFYIATVLNKEVKEIFPKPKNQ